MTAASTYLKALPTNQAYRSTAAQLLQLTGAVTAHTSGLTALPTKFSIGKLMLKAKDSKILMVGIIQPEFNGQPCTQNLAGTSTAYFHEDAMARISTALMARMMVI